VRIVDGTAASAAWRTRPSALFTVGWETDDPTFTWVQSGRILPGGGALVGEFAEGTIYRLGSDGAVLGSWGGKGEGPGEYQGIDAIVLAGDSILISDGRLRRLTVLAGDGAVLGTRPLPGAFLHSVSSILSDGRAVLVPGEGYGGVAEMRPEWVFQPQPILAADLDSEAVDTLTSLPHLRRWYGTRGAGPGPVAVKGRAGGFAGGFAWGRSDVPEVRWYGASGDVVQIARWEEEAPPLTPDRRREILQGFEAAIRSSGGDESSVARQLTRLEEGLERHEGPLPYWSYFVVDRSGNAWLSEYLLAPPAPARWRIVTRDGGFIGWLDLPGVISILDITDDRLLVVRWDELDVPAVQMLELIKP
jgi:hypothetical protein